MQTLENGRRPFMGGSGVFLRTPVPFSCFQSLRAVSSFECMLFFPCLNPSIVLKL